MTLFIDTHCSLITIGLIDEENIFVVEKESDKSHSIYLLPMIEKLLESNELKLTDLKSVIVVNGPGSFTGVRIGFSVAKMLSYSLNIPIRTISSLYAYLISNESNKNKTCVVEDSKGYYISKADKNNKIIQEETYVSNLTNLENLDVIENKIDLRMIYEAIKNIEPTDVYLVKANYIKKIEAEKNE